MPTFRTNDRKKCALGALGFREKKNQHDYRFCPSKNETNQPPLQRRAGLIIAQTDV